MGATRPTAPPRAPAPPRWCGAGSSSTPRTWCWAGSPRASPRCCAASTRRSSRRTSTPATSSIVVNAEQGAAHRPQARAEGLSAPHRLDRARAIGDRRQAARRARTPSAWCARPCAACCRRTRWAGRCSASSRSTRGPSTRTRPSSRRSSNLPEAATVFVATGKRKTAVARVRLRIGQRPVPRERPHARGLLPARGVAHDHPSAARGGRTASAATTSSRSLHGGGISGQADALRHGITRALEKLDPGDSSARSRSAAS